VNDNGNDIGNDNGNDSGTIEVVPLAVSRVVAVHWPIGPTKGYLNE